MAAGFRTAAKAALFAACAVPSLLTAQESAPTSVARGGATVRGMVHDSTRGFPLARAVVQLAAADRDITSGRTVVTDSNGRFAFSGLTGGRYLLGFHHPLLDSLGIDLTPTAVEVSGDEVTTTLTVPSEASLRALVCGETRANRAGALLLGHVRDTRLGGTLAGADVSVEWLEYAMGRGRVAPSVTRRTVRTASNGWFSLCDVPREGIVLVRAIRGADSTDFVELSLDGTDLQRHDLYLATGDAAPATVKLGGVVHRADGRSPLADATVSTADGRSVRTNARGEFLLTGVPAGSRLLEVRAVGYYPERIAVQALDDAPAITAELRTFRSVLDTVKVLANFPRFDALRELRHRARSGIGRILLADDIAKRRPLVTSDLLRTIPGVFVTPGIGTDQTISMRGLFNNRCTPTLGLNGTPFLIGFQNAFPLTAQDLDSFARPDDLVGIEIYAAAQVPPEYLLGGTACGAIVLWTR